MWTATSSVADPHHFDADPDTGCEKVRYFLIFLFTAYQYFIYTVLQCDLPPLRPSCGEAPGRDSNPGWAI